MDISICLVDKKTKKVKFSGSRNGIHIVDSEEINSIKGDLTPVGGYALLMKKVRIDPINYMK